MTTASLWGIAEEVGTAFDAMSAAALLEGIKLKIVFGYRSPADQKIFFDEGMKRRGETPEKRSRDVAPPGYCQNSTGYAIEINSSEQTFAKTPAFKWLQNNAIAFGFEMPFGQNNSQGINFQPYHWIYTGSEAARLALAPLTLEQVEQLSE